VKGLPVVDAHNHADVGEIARDANYSDPWQVFAATDHYVWEMLRKRGVDEKFITGGATPKEKWLKMGEVFPEIVGNPVYEWIHLDLKRMLGIDELLGPDSRAQDLGEGLRRVRPGLHAAARDPKGDERRGHVLDRRSGRPAGRARRRREGRRKAPRAPDLAPGQVHEHPSADLEGLLGKAREALRTQARQPRRLEARSRSRTTTSRRRAASPPTTAS
jgi:hypothetical protein